MSGVETNMGTFYQIVFLGVLISALGGIGLVLINRLIRQEMTFRAYERWLSQVKPLEQVRGLTPQQFECFIAELFQKMGYLTHLVSASGNGEAEVVAMRGGKKHLIECKKYNSRRVRRAAVRNFYGTRVNSPEDLKGVFVTTGKFTASAEKYAENKSIELVDGAQLLEYMQVVGIGDIVPPETMSLRKPGGKDE